MMSGRLLLLASSLPLAADSGPSPTAQVLGGSITSCLLENEELARNRSAFNGFADDQDFEINFHLKDLNGGWRASPDFTEQSEALFGSWGLGKRDFEDQVIVDMGAGSRLRSAYFEGARLVVIEPMAERLLQHVAERPLIDIGHPAKVWQLYAMPAEFRACAVEGLASLVICVNVLDHVAQPERLLHNAERLLRPCSAGPSLFILSFDLRQRVTIGHPHILTRRWVREQVHANHSKLRLVRAWVQDVVVHGARRQSWSWSFDDGRADVAWTFMFRRRCGKEIDARVPKPDVSTTL